MKALTVDYEMIAQSMRDLCREANDYFFDKNSGRVISLSRSMIRALAERSEDERDRVPEWDAPLVPIARQIVVLGNYDFVRIPEAYGRPEHRWMNEFCETVRGPKLRQKLTLSLKGRESCQRFKELLKDHIEEQSRWMLFRGRKWEETVQIWLEGHGILAIGSRTVKRRLAA